MRSEKTRIRYGALFFSHPLSLMGERPVGGRLAGHMQAQSYIVEMP